MSSESKKHILSIESSCDDCAIAILDQNAQICADLVFSQIEGHQDFGGIVPEIASRQHLAKISFLTQEAFKIANLEPKDISAVAVTNRPGLIGSLLVGVQFAKGFAQALNINIIGIDHIEGHLLAGLGEDNFPKPPFIGLIISGGHSALYYLDKDYNRKLLGQTRDDAAGEAFDKVGRMLGLDYPAGKEVDKYAVGGDDQRFKFPIALKNKDTYEYSFSGLKTAAKRKIEKIELLDKQTKKDFCASLQKAISEALLNKAILACENLNVKKLVIGGGVTANSRLRADAQKLCESRNYHLYLPKKSHCTDNAVMIGRAAWRRLKLGEQDNLMLGAHAS